MISLDMIDTISQTWLRFSLNKFVRIEKIQLKATDISIEKYHVFLISYKCPKN